MDISIVIPCFNHGNFIQEAIDSVLACKGISYEIIIINDGSTDIHTIAKLDGLEKKGFQVITQANKGLGYARNVGIKKSKGRYILPLDADNKINPDYIYKAIKILENNKADIVYANPIFFGENIEERKFKVKAFNGTDLVYGNFIDACAIYKKEVWIKLNGYDVDMPFNGHEDWEFWLSSFISGFSFFYINEDLYFYRIVADSMMAKVSMDDKTKFNYEYIIKKHASSIIKLIGPTYQYGKMYQRDMENPLRSSLKYLYHFFKPKNA